MDNSSIHIVVTLDKLFANYDLLAESLDKLLVNKTCVYIQTTETSDLLIRYSLERGYDLVLRKPAWEVDGKHAGRFMSYKMFKSATHLIAITNGDSKKVNAIVNVAKDLDIVIRIGTYK